MAASINVHGNPLARLVVSNIYHKCVEDDIRAIFEPFGGLKFIQFIEDDDTRSGRMCYVDFVQPFDANTATQALTGFVLAGQKIMVVRMQPPANMAGQGPRKIVQGANITLIDPESTMSPEEAARQAAQVCTQNAFGQAGGQMMSQQPSVGMARQMPPIGTGSSSTSANVSGDQAARLSAALGRIQAQIPGPNKCRIYVGSINFELGEQEIRLVFQAFGTIVNCALMPSETGGHKGFGFIEFDNPNAAGQAIREMNGFELAGRQLKVGYAQVTGPFPTGGAPALSSAAQAAMADPSVSAMSSAGAGASPVILLKNMVGADDVDDELPGEVREECSRYGVVNDVQVKIVSGQVRIFVLFAETHYAAKALTGLSGRWFAGRRIEAGYYDKEKFDSGNFM